MKYSRIESGAAIKVDDAGAGAASQDEAILEADTSCAHGLEISFYENPVFEDTAAVGDDEKLLMNARNFMRFLLIGLRVTIGDFNFFSTHNWTKLTSRDLLDSILSKRNPEMLRALRHEFQNVFNTINAHIDEHGADIAKNIHQHNQLILLIQNIIALYPFADPSSTETIDIPRYQEGKWSLVKHSIELIEMTPNIPSLRSHIKDEDKVFSYGLTPLDDEFASILVFMGTTYPSGQGKKIQDFTNAIADHDIGKQLFLWGKDQIQAWLGRVNTDDKKALVTGASLGGILATMFSMHIPESFDEVYAFNPPGFKSLPTIADPYFSSWFTSDYKPNIFIVSQKGDPVSSAGFFVDDPCVILLKSKLPFSPGIKAPIVNNYLSHIIIHAGHCGVDFTVTRVSLVNDNASRKALTSFAFGVLKPVMGFFASLKHPELSRHINTPATTPDTQDDEPEVSTPGDGKHEI